MTPHLSLAVFSTVALGRMDVALVARNVGVQDPAVIGKAREYMRLASVRLSGGLGQVRAHVLAVLSRLDLASRSSSASTSTHTHALCSAGRSVQGLRVLGACVLKVGKVHVRSLPLEAGHSAARAQPPAQSVACTVGKVLSCQTFPSSIDFLTVLNLNAAWEQRSAHPATSSSALGVRLPRYAADSLVGATEKCITVHCAINLSHESIALCEAWKREGP